MYNLLASAFNHPNDAQPYRSLFNERSLQALSSHANIDVISPRPFAPPIGPYAEYGTLPRVESWGAYEIHRPRFWYLVPKRLFYGLSGRSFANRIPPYIEDHFEVPDVVHACHIYLDGYGLLPYVRKHDIPLFLFAHGSIINTFEHQPESVRSKVIETLDEATGIFAVSDALASKTRTLTDPEKISTVALGADPSNFPIERSSEIRKEMNIAEDSTVVLFVGQFIERKGIPELLEVVPSFEYPTVEFVFVGHGGDLRGEVNRVVSETDRPQDRIKWQLSTEELRQIFSIADLLVLPSYNEGRPTVIYEAMASETAVLASHVGGIPEQVADGETGLLVPPGDIEALEAAIRELTTDRDRLDAMGDRGRERLIEKGWTWNEHARRVRDRHLEELS